MTTGGIYSLADVRPGDIGIMTMGGIVPGLIPVRLGQWACKESFTIGPFSADHVLICVREGYVNPNIGRIGTVQDLPRAVQAMPRGAEEIALTPAKHWTSGVAWFRPTEDYPGQAADAAAIARLFVSERVGYSFASYPALALWSRGMKAERLERWIGRRRRISAQQQPKYDLFLPERAICSVLVDQAWTLAGKRVIEGVARMCVTPGMMAIQLDRRYTAYGPGFLASAQGR